MWIRRAITAAVVASLTAVAMLWWLSDPPVNDSSTPAASVAEPSP